MAELTGLTSEQAQRQQELGKGNHTRSTTGKTEKEIILEHCFTYFNLVFLILAVILAVSGSGLHNMTFLVIVIINTVIGILQQLRAKRAVDKLTLVAAQQVETLRDGQWCPLRSELLVEEDTVRFHAGDQICADGTVLSGTLHVNEALLTGEADAVVKGPGDPVLSGSFVVSGTAAVKLTQVGDASFASRLAQEATADPRAKKSEMMRSLDKLIRVLGILLIPVGLLLFYQEYAVLKLGLRDSAEATVAALVGMIPEGLYLLTSIALSASAIKLTKNRVLVQDMSCIEALARVDILCVDKTGTVTEPTMTVENVERLDGVTPERLEEILTALYGSREPDNDTGRAIGELFAGKSEWVWEKEIPFDSAYKWFGGEFTGQGSFLVGAPDRLLCPEDPLFEAVDRWQGEGCRVLLAAEYQGSLCPGTLDPGRIRPLALLLLSNRVRESAPEIFSYFARQGVTVKVISGDSPLTVSRVAQRAQIPDSDRFVDASTLHTEAEIANAVRNCTVFGRVTPEMKKKLIAAMKKQGHTVAMTGDGVNDVLALKEADCGVAMASGAPAAAQVARLVLTDSDFSAMPGIVDEGRRVINNIQRAASLFLVKNILSLGLSLLCLFTGWAYPFQPFHLSIISALTIGVPGFFLAMEPNHEPVRGKFLPTVLRRALPGGLTNLAVVALVYLLMRSVGLPLTDCATVCTAVLAFVGMLVLYQVCTPFDRFRRIVWIAMLVALVGCFTLLRVPFELTVTDIRTYPVLLAALLAVPTVLRLLHLLIAKKEKRLC